MSASNATNLNGGQLRKGGAMVECGAAVQVVVVDGDGSVDPKLHIEDQGLKWQSSCHAPGDVNEKTK